MMGLESVSFLEQYRISPKINSLGITKKPGSVTKSSWVLLLHISLDCLMTQYTNLFGNQCSKTFI